MTVVLWVTACGRRDPPPPAPEARVLNIYNWAAYNPGPALKRAVVLHFGAYKAEKGDFVT
jgi:hypothetical protein